MFWLLKKIFGIAVLAAVVFVGLHFQVGGRPVKDYLIDFYHSALVQEAIRQSRDAIGSYLQKDVQPAVTSKETPSSAQQDDGPAPMDKVNDDERQELEKVIRKQSH